MKFNRGEWSSVLGVVDVLDLGRVRLNGNRLGRDDIVDPWRGHRQIHHHRPTPVASYSCAMMLPGAGYAPARPARERRSWGAYRQPVAAHQDTREAVKTAGIRRRRPFLVGNRTRQFDRDVRQLLAVGVGHGSFDRSGVRAPRRKELNCIPESRKRHATIDRNLSFIVLQPLRRGEYKCPAIDITYVNQTVAGTSGGNYPQK